MVVRLLRTVKGVSVGYSWPNNWGLRTNSKLIPEVHFMQVERERVVNNENHNLSGGSLRKERQVEGYYSQ